MVEPAELAQALDPTERRMLHMIADGKFFRRGSKGQQRARARLRALGLLVQVDRTPTVTERGHLVRKCLLEQEGRTLQ